MRLGLVQQVLQEQLARLPGHVVPVLVSFGQQVTVHGAGQISSSRELEDLRGLVEAGANLALGLSGDDCGRRAKELKASGGTALGPALAVSVGIAGTLPGSQVVLLTDGMANVGCGKMSAGPEEFYAELGVLARDRGARVSVVTMAGEDSAVAHLGTASDLSGGDVDVVEPSYMEEAAAAMVARATLLTDACLLVTLAGAQLRGAKSVEGVYCVPLGSVHRDTDVALELVVDGPVQLDVTVQGLCRGERVSVACSKHLEASKDRSEAEQQVRADVAAVAGIQAAARLAEAGDYQAARVRLISTQRLLQRSMHSQAQQRAYMNFICQGEKLDGFMREQQQRAALLGTAAQQVSLAGRRDDEAARAVFASKGLNLRELRASTMA